MSENTAESKPKRTPATKKVEQESEVMNVEITSSKDTTVNEEGQKVISGPAKPKPSKKSNMHSKDDSSAIASHAADRALSRKTDTTKNSVKKEEAKKVAVWSNKNIRWTGVGTLSKGYNVVTEEAAEKWLAKEGIRKATPEEVATYFSK